MTTIIIQQRVDGAYGVVAVDECDVTYDAVTASVSDAITCAKVLYDDYMLTDEHGVRVVAPGFDAQHARSVMGYITEWEEYDEYAAMMAA